MNEEAIPLLQLSLEHIKKMLLEAEQPELPQDGQDIEHLQFIHDYLAYLRNLLKDFSIGNLSANISLRGSVAGSLKALQANLLHLTWQIQQVAGGDFRHRVDFMGEFSDAFNSMVVQLDSALTALRNNEAELMRLTDALQQEIELKNQAMTALRKSEANFRYKAEHDPLTGVLNRRSFYAHASAGMELAATERSYCAVAILDIDHFKQFNDGYGHLHGDNALKHITELARRTLRDADLIGRFGGDEFVLFLSFATKKAGKSVVERFRAAVESTPVAVDDQRASITISVGMACIAPEYPGNRDIDMLQKAIRLADRGLYTAKAKGRNRVIMRTLSAADVEITE